MLSYIGLYLYLMQHILSVHSPNISPIVYDEYCGMMGYIYRALQNLVTFYFINLKLLH